MKTPKDETADYLAYAIECLKIALDTWKAGRSASAVLSHIDSAESRLAQCVARLRVHTGD